MARKDVIPPFAMFGASGCDMSQSVSVSKSTDALYLDNIGIIVSWSGSSPVGTLYIDVLDPVQNVWATLDFGSLIAITGNSGTHDITLNQLPFGKLRARYVMTSGTGSLYATLSAKQVGG